MRDYIFDTTEGRAAFKAESPAPRVLMIHGFQRHPGPLLPWRDRIPDLGFVFLPGHGRAPDFREVSLAAWTRGLRQLLETLPQPPLLIAESLGAVIAMGLPYRALIAIEPLLSVDQLWPLHDQIRKLRGRGASRSGRSSWRSSTSRSMAGCRVSRRRPWFWPETCR